MMHEYMTQSMVEQVYSEDKRREGERKMCGHLLCVFPALRFPANRCLGWVKKEKW